MPRKKKIDSPVPVVSNSNKRNFDPAALAAAEMSMFGGGLPSASLPQGQPSPFGEMGQPAPMSGREMESVRGLRPFVEDTKARLNVLELQNEILIKRVTNLEHLISQYLSG